MSAEPLAGSLLSGGRSLVVHPAGMHRTTVMTWGLGFLLRRLADTGSPTRGFRENARRRALPSEQLDHRSR